MSLIAQLSAAGVTISKEEVRTTTPADVAMLMADVEYSHDLLAALPQLEHQDLVDSEEIANMQIAMENLVDFYSEAQFVHRQISSEGMQNSAGVRIGTLRLAEMRERIGFSNLSFSPESHQELTQSSEGFLQSIWDAIVKVAKAIKNFFKRLFGMQVDDEELGGSDAVSPSAVDNMGKRLKEITTEKSITIPKDVFEKSIMSVDTADVNKLRDGIKKLEDIMNWLTDRKKQITHLLTAAEGLTPMDMEAEYVNAVASLKHASEHSKKDILQKENQEVLKGGFLFGFSSGRSMHVYMCRESGKPEVKFKSHLFDDKPESYSDMTIGMPSSLGQIIDDYHTFQTRYIAFTKEFGSEVMNRQEKFEKWAEDHAKRNSDDAEKEQMQKLLASIRSTQGMVIEIGSIYKAYRTAVGTFESVLMAIGGKYLKLIEEGGGETSVKKETSTDLPKIDESMIEEGAGEGGSREERRERVVKRLE